jgi:hypothetical protein
VKPCRRARGISVATVGLGAHWHEPSRLLIKPAEPLLVSDFDQSHRQPLFGDDYLQVLLALLHRTG